MSGSLRLLVIVCLLFAAACSDQEMVVPEASAPLFAVSDCKLGVSDAEARTEMNALSGKIADLSGRLNAGQATALRNLLENARRSLDSGKYCPALAQLQAFRDLVKRFVGARVLTAAEAQPLLAGIGLILEGTGSAPPPVTSVTVAPTAPSIEVGQVVQLTATTNTSALASTAQTIGWSSSNEAVATVDASGLVRGASAGTATITATSSGQSGSATVTVTARPVASVTVAPPTPSVVAGQTVQLTATTRDASNNVLTGRTVGWTSSNDAVATVDASGLVTGRSAGTATIIATSEGRSGSATLTVTPHPVASVSVAPPTPSVVAGETVQLTATTRDASNNELTGRAIGWSSSDESVATVDTNGLVTGVNPGTATITATSEGRSGSATVTVTPVPVASITVVPVSPTVVGGQTVQLTATTRDAGNNVLTGRAIAWSSSNEVVATVDPNGLVTGRAAGTATITATSEGQSGSAFLTVTPRPPLNPSFELDGSLANFYGASPTGWPASGLSSVDTDNFGGDVGPATTTTVFNFPHYVTQGTYGARLFTRPGLNSSGETISRTFNAGDRVSVSQQMDFTGVVSLMFDAQLRSIATTWRSAFVASVLIDGVTVWSGNVSAIYRDRAIDTSDLSGLHTLEFRLEAVTTNVVSGSPSMWFMFDNVRLVR